MNEPLTIKIVIGIIAYICYAGVYIWLYWRNAERHESSFSERFVLGPILAGRLTWKGLLLYFSLPIIILVVWLGYTNIMRHPFWEEDTETTCIESGGIWYDSGSDTDLLVGILCPITTTLPPDNEPLILPNTNQPRTIGYCRCAEHYCWDEQLSKCVAF